jgi:hypothetical protein
MKKKFLQQTQVYCNTLPYSIPVGVIVDETTEESGGRYIYRLTPENDAILNELTAHLEVANITYTARVNEKEGAANKVLNNPNESFTMQIAWLIFLIVIAFIFIMGIPQKIWTDLTAGTEIKITPTPKIIENGPKE